MQNDLFKKAFLYFVLSISFFSCGGGGGGGGGSGSRSSSPTGVRVLFASINASPVDLFSSANKNVAVQTQRFGDVPFYANVPQGNQILTLSLHLNPTTVYSQNSVTVEKNQHTTLLLYGDNDKLGLNTSVITDEAGEVPSGQSAIRIVHGLVGAAKLSGNAGTTSLTDAVEFGQASSYVFVNSGINPIVVKRVSDGNVVFNGSINALSESTYSIFMSGEIGYLVLGNILED